MVTPGEAVADARLGQDRDAGFAQRRDIAIHRANADFEMPGEVFGPHNSPALQAQRDGYETVHSIHAR